VYRAAEPSLLMSPIGDTPPPNLRCCLRRPAHAERVSRPTMRAANLLRRRNNSTRPDSFEADYVGRTGAFRGGGSPTCGLSR
jgi:hypothetical protein